MYTLDLRREAMSIECASSPPKGISGRSRTATTSNAGGPEIRVLILCKPA